MHIAAWLHIPGWPKILQFLEISKILPFSRMNVGIPVLTWKYPD